jgi:polysaccharide biosynthesis/export protein
MQRVTLLVALILAILLFQSAQAQQPGTFGLSPGSPVTTSPGGAGQPIFIPGQTVPGSSIPTITNRGLQDGMRDPRLEDGRREILPFHQLELAPEPPNEFQEFVAASAGRHLPLFGYDLFLRGPSTFAPLDGVPVTPDYVIGPGDEILIRAWGQVDIDYRTVVDRNGTIHIPQVGTLTVRGLRYQDLHGFIRASIARIFRNFELSVNLGQLRSVQIFVVGHARRPGAYTVSSLSTLVNALFASGGPSTRGSMRRIQLKRGNEVITEFDMYDLLLRGDKSKDARLLPGDVIFVPPIGELVAISGSVNHPAIYELKENTSLAGLIQLAGGLAVTAAGQKATVERITDRGVRQVDEFALDHTGFVRTVRNGDVVQIRALSPRFDNAITLRGAVANPGRYPWRDGMRVRDILPDREALIVADYWQRQNLVARSTAADGRLRPDGEPWFRTDADWQTQARDARFRADDPRFRSDDPRFRSSDPRLRTNEAAFRAEDPRFRNDDRRWRDEDPRLRNDERTWEERRRARSNADPRLHGEGEHRLRTELKRSFDEINWDYAVIERLNLDDLSTMLIPFNLARALMDGDTSNNLLLRPGDVVTIFSKADIQVPVARQTQFVRLEGELAAPGVYQIMPGETLRQLVTRVGGFTPNAYLYGAEFTRETVRETQQRRLDETLDRFAQEIERNAAAMAVSGRETAQAGQVQTQVESQRQLLARMREVRATGRIVLDIQPERTEIRYVPDIALEDGDRFVVPSRPSTVAVVGAVYNQNAFIHDSSKRVSDYLQQAGGPTRDADSGRIYVIRADGSVVGRAHASVLTGRPTNERPMPGDTVVVPESLERFNLTRELRDWSQIFYQFALGVAGLKVLRDL